MTVRPSGQNINTIYSILDKYDPIDIDERAGAYGLSQAGTAGTASRPAAAGDEESIQLAEESLAVGKRAVNRGTTRIRRYVVETPVEESINLREERVSVERRPVSDARAVTDADFTDKVVEVTETDEEAVVSKTARVREEVVIRKDVADRTETVRDTVRREDVEITKDAGADRAVGTTQVENSKPV